MTHSVIYRFFAYFDIIDMFDHGEISIPPNLQGALVSSKDYSKPEPLDSYDVPKIKI